MILSLYGAGTSEGVLCSVYQAIIGKLPEMRRFRRFPGLNMARN
jgi:hypothetical protein